MVRTCHRHLNPVFNPKLAGCQIIRDYLNSTALTSFFPDTSILGPSKTAFNAAQLVVHKVCFALHSKSSVYFETFEEKNGIRHSKKLWVYSQKRDATVPREVSNPTQFQASNCVFPISYSPQSQGKSTNPTLQKDFIERLEKYFVSQQYLKQSFQCVNNM